MEKIKFKEHIPNFVDGIEPKTFEFETIEELLEHNKEWVEDKKLVFAQSEDNDLMVSSTVERWWWVLGYVDGVDLSKHLPKYDTVFKPENSKKGIDTDVQTK